MATLASVERIEFAALKRQVNATDGNLGMHLHKLETAGYIAADKQFCDRKPITYYSLTRLGKRAFAQYLDQLTAWLPKTRA